MTSISTPDLWLLQGVDAHAGRLEQLALMLPTTRALLDCRMYRRAGIVVGDMADAGQLTPEAALRHLDAIGKPDLVFIHSDTLVRPGVANVLVRLDDFDAYVSAIEYLFNAKHGYRLGAWTSDGWQYLEPDRPIDEVVRLVARHLRCCTRLGDHWLAAGMQHQRMPANRDMRRERMLRFVRSSIASAFSDAPGDPRLRAASDTLGAAAWKTPMASPR